jgi:aldehyde:ferredoxin oxidoreductase
MLGYAGKILEINLTTEKVTEASFSEDVLESYIGGRGLAAKILWDRLGDKWETVDPFSPENILLILTGPLTGFFPGGRVCVSGKSPQSNGMIGSTVAGEFGIDLKCSGYDGLIITGKAAKPSYITVFEKEVSIKDATHIWGKDGKQTLRILTKEGRAQLKASFPNYGELKEPSALYIGPAGENKTRIAAVMGKWTHAAGYGGYGGVMGSKNLKAILAKGLGPLPEVHDIETVKKLIDHVSQLCYHESFRRWGTGAGGFNFGNQSSSEPIRNWQEEWHEEKSYAVDQFEQRLWVKKYWGDYGCPTTCLKISVPKTGEFKGCVTDNPDYELQAYLGPNLGIFKPEDDVYLSSLIDDLGLCGIQTGNVMGFAAELYQRKILNEKDLDGIKPEWGNTKAFAELAKKIALREGIGDTLAEGSYRAAVKLGKIKGQDLTNYVVHEKGMAIGAHGIRSGRDFLASNICYACSVQAGDHTSVAELPSEYGGGESGTIWNDSAVICLFNTFAVDDELQWRFFNAVTGWTTVRQEWSKTNALRILNIQRAMLLLGGPDLKWKPNVDDENPPRFYEPLPSGPYKGRAVKKKTFEVSKQEYYAAVGWNENGLPKKAILKKIGLQDVENKLRKAHILPN